MNGIGGGVAESFVSSTRVAWCDRHERRSDAILGDDGIDDVHDSVLIVRWCGFQGAESFKQVQRGNGLIIGLASSHEIVNGDGEEISQMN